MGLLTLIPGDDAIHTPTQTRVHILSYADGNFTTVAMDSENNLINTRRIVGAVKDFVPLPRVTAPKSADPGLSATAQRIADLQAQVAALQEKLQCAEASRDEAASRAAELLAQPAQSSAPAATRTEVRVLRNTDSIGLAEYLNAGWTVMHMQFVAERDKYDDGSTRGTVNTLNVVLQRTVPNPQPQPEQRAAVPRTVAGTVVPMSQRIDDDDDYEEPDDVPPLPALDPDPLMPAPLSMYGEGQGVGTLSSADFTRAVLSARLPPAQTMELLNNRLKETARAAFNAAPAPAPFVPLMGVSTK